MTQDIRGNDSRFSIQKLVRQVGAARLIIFAFFVFLCVMAGVGGISVPTMISYTLIRMGRNGVLVLAMLPGIQSGIRLNFGITLGIVAGLLSTLLCIEYGLTGWYAFGFSCVLGCAFAIPLGILYGFLLNRMKGNEMTVSTYVGFSFVALMCMAWVLLPFQNNALKYALGPGLRVTHNMNTSYGSILDNLWSFTVGGVYVPTGLLLFLFACCLLVWLFMRSKTGAAMIAAGGNPRFAAATGIPVDRMRIIGTTLSTVIAAIGIIVYQQSYGFFQLYNAPRMMGFIAASAILIGGASVMKAKVSHVIVGSFLFQGVLTLGIQVANKYIDIGGLSEVMRILISNGIILYALTTVRGDSNGG